MSSNKTNMIPKSLMDKQEQEKVEKAEKYIGDLRRQANISRMPISQSGREIFEYCTQHLEEDAMARGVEKYPKKHPLRASDPSLKKGMCTII